VHNTAQGCLGFRTQLLSHSSSDTTTSLRVGFAEIRTDPLLDVLDFREGISRDRLAGVQSGETNTKADIFDIAVLDNQVVGSLRKRRIDKKLEECLAGEAPTLLAVTINKGLTVGEGVSERNNGSLAVEWSRQLLCVGKDDLRYMGVKTFCWT